MRIIIASVLGIALAGCGESGERLRFGEANSWALAVANPVGPPADCIQRAAIRGHAARDDRTIDFVMEDGGVLRNRLPFACAGLARNNRFTYRTAQPRLCSTDTITLIEPGGAAGGSCGLGMFQPITVPPRQGIAPGGD